VKDEITKKGGQFIITLDGVAKPMNEWLIPEIPRKVLRNRCERWMRHPERHSVKSIVTEPSLRNGCLPKKTSRKTVRYKETCAAFDKWEIYRNRVAVTWRIP